MDPGGGGMEVKTKREITLKDIDAMGRPLFFSYLFDYWVSAPEIPPIPQRLLDIQPDITWEELFYNYGGNQFTQFILRRIWEKL